MRNIPARLSFGRYLTFMFASDNATAPDYDSVLLRSCPPLSPRALRFRGTSFHPLCHFNPVVFKSGSHKSVGCRGRPAPLRLCCPPSSRSLTSLLYSYSALPRTLRNRINSVLSTPSSTAAAVPVLPVHAVSVLSALSILLSSPSSSCSYLLLYALSTLRLGSTLCALLHIPLRSPKHGLNGF